MISVFAETKIISWNIFQDFVVSKTFLFTRKRVNFIQNSTQKQIGTECLYIVKNWKTLIKFWSGKLQKHMQSFFVYAQVQHSLLPNAFFSSLTSARKLIKRAHFHYTQKPKWGEWKNGTLKEWNITITRGMSAWTRLFICISRWNFWSFLSVFMICTTYTFMNN